MLTAAPVNFIFSMYIETKIIMQGLVYATRSDGPHQQVPAFRTQQKRGGCVDRNHGRDWKQTLNKLIVSNLTTQGTADGRNTHKFASQGPLQDQEEQGRLKGAAIRAEELC